MWRGNSVLKFIFNTKEKKGFIFNPSLTPLDMYTALVYDNVSDTPFMYLYTHKEQKYSWTSKTPLYHLIES